MPESFRLLNLWFKTRMLRVPLILLCVAFALRSDTPLRVLVAATLSLAFLRFVDDASDRDRDRVAHPERVLPRAKNTHVIFAGALLLAFAQGALFLCGFFLPFLFSAFVVVALALYGIRTLSSSPTSLFWRHLVLLKYPALAALLLDEKTSTLLLLLGACGLYEMLHDPALDPKASKRWRWFIVDGALVFFGLFAQLH